MNSVYKTPCFILEQKRLDKNLEKLAHIEEQSGVKILHSIKSFNQKALYCPL